MKSTQTKKNTCEILNFSGNYSGFVDFYDKNKREVYNSILKVFDEFTHKKSNTSSLYMSAMICNFEWDTEIKFRRDDTIILTRDILPFFEKLEDYETCSRIKKLHKDLTT
jgi:hypothetical protein